MGTDTQLTTFAQIAKALRTPGMKAEVYVSAFNAHMRTPKGHLLRQLAALKRHADGGELLDAWGSELIVVIYADTPDVVSFR